MFFRGLFETFIYAKLRVVVSL